MENDDNRMKEIMNEVNNIISNNISEIESLISDNEVVGICNKYKKHNETKDNLGFNIFAIVSDRYYHEKFHSQIIASILNPKESHNEKNKFLHLFLEFLKDSWKDKYSKIKIENYLNSEVTGTKEIGERKFIDIWIQDRNSKHCVIIENKINNAEDQHRQIPTYFKKAKDEGYSVDAIIYLSLDGKKTNLDEKHWTPDEKNEIDKLYKQIATFNSDGGNNDLYNGWLLPCINIATDIDALLILRQYSKLIKYQNKTTMNYLIMNDFFELIIKDNNFDTALKIRDMITNDLTGYKAYRLKKYFEPKLNRSPFSSIIVTDRCRFDGFIWRNSKIVIEIRTNEERIYRIQFFDFTYYYEGGEIDNAKVILKEINLLGLFNQTDPELPGKYWYDKQYEFPKQEKELMDFIDLLNESLLEYVRGEN